MLWAVGTPASRSASFMAGLSRQSQAVRVEVPGISHCSRTQAQGVMWASTVASRRSTQERSWTRHTAARSASPLVTDGTCSCPSSQPRSSLSRALGGASAMAVTRAPTSFRARTNSLWLDGKEGSTKMTCMAWGGREDAGTRASMGRRGEAFGWGVRLCPRRAQASWRSAMIAA